MPKLVSRAAPDNGRDTSLPLLQPRTPTPIDNTGFGANSDHIIGSVRKNARETVAIALRTYKGIRLIDVRVVVPTPDGGTTPTAKGVALRLECLPDLIALLQRAHAAAVEAGWCRSDGA